MDFKKYLEKSARQIDDELDEILSKFLNETKKTNIKLLPFALGLLNSCKGGKRIRGVLVKMGYEIASPKLEIGNWKLEILKVGAAFEILHAGLLIHDDIMDKSPTRRGKPSLHKSLGGGHLGISQAISIGDIGLYLPVKIIINTNFLGEYKLKVLETLSQMVINTGWGQVMDVESGDKNFINLYKTAKYTIAGPLQLGAILAGAEPALIKKLGEFGENLGIAFQLHDDILDSETKDLDEDRAKEVEYIALAKKLIPEITNDQKMKIILSGMCEFLAQRNT